MVQHAIPRGTGPRSILSGPLSGTGLIGVSDVLRQWASASRMIWYLSSRQCTEACSYVSSTQNDIKYEFEDMLQYA